MVPVTILADVVAQVDSLMETGPCPVCGVSIPTQDELDMFGGPLDARHPDTCPLEAAMRRARLAIIAEEVR